MASGRFLTAEWRSVAMLNYEVDPSLVRPFVPVGTELAFWNGKTYVSLVGFRFLATKVFGIPIPFHGDFDEVNLRFYVVRREAREVKRGVVFIREIVPRRAVAKIARAVYNENYVALPMSHRINNHGSTLEAEYAWRCRDEWSKIRLVTTGIAILPADGSQEQFIAEHYWGYSAQRDGGTLEYRVEHPPWRVWSSHDAKFEGDMEELYGRDLAEIVARRPSSAFLAEGSPVTVYCGRRLANT